MQYPNYDTNHYFTAAHILIQQQPHLSYAAIARQLGVSPSSIARYLRDVKPPRECRPWLEDEVKLLEKLVETVPTSVLAQKLKRTESAVRLKAASLGFSVTSTLDNYSSRYLARNLGVNRDTTTRWIASGLLKATKTKGQWMVSKRDFAAFCQQHPEKVKGCDQEVIAWLSQGA